MRKTIYFTAIGFVVFLSSFFVFQRVDKDPENILPCVCLNVSELVRPSIKIIVDNSKEWEAGSIHPIKWKKSCNVDKVELEISKLNGSVILKEELVPCDSVFLLTVPDTGGEKLRLKVVGFNNRTKESFSDNNFITTCNGDSSRYAWKKLTEHAGYYERDGSIMVSINDTLFLFGGWNPYKKFHTNNEIWYTINGRDWKFLKNAPWTGRHTYGNCYFKGSFWIIGGDCNQGYYQSDIWKTNDGVNWEKVLDSIPWIPRQNFGVRVYDNKIWLFGGERINYTIAEEAVSFNDVWCSEDGIHWEQVTHSAPWSPRGHLGSLADKDIVQDSLILLGGADYNKRTLSYSEVWTSVDGISWRVRKNIPWISKRYSDLAFYDGKIWVVGGASVEQLNTNEVWYTKDLYNWYCMRDVPFPGRHATSLASYKGALVMSAGYLYNDVWHLDKLN